MCTRQKTPSETLRERRARFDGTLWSYRFLVEFRSHVSVQQRLRELITGKQFTAIRAGLGVDAPLAIKLILSEGEDHRCKSPSELIDWLGGGRGDSNTGSSEEEFGSSSDS